MTHKNTIWIMAWASRMTEIYGNPCNPLDYDWCRKLAYYTGEAGNDYPSDDAIKIAADWERNGPA